LGFLILGFATTLLMLFVGRIIDGISGGNISTAQAYIADVTTKEDRAKGMGLIGAAFGLGFVFGPAIGGVLSRWGINVPFLFAGGLALANAILLYFTLPETVTPDHPARVSCRQRPWLGSGNRFPEKPASGVRADNLFSFHRGLLDHDSDLFAVFDVPAWVTTRFTMDGSSPSLELSQRLSRAD
jgi:MFS family permease